MFRRPLEQDFTYSWLINYWFFSSLSRRKSTDEREQLSSLWLWEFTAEPSPSARPLKAKVKQKQRKNYSKQSTFSFLALIPRKIDKRASHLGTGPNMAWLSPLQCPTLPGDLFHSWQSLAGGKISLFSINFFHRLAPFHFSLLCTPT